MRRRYDAPAGGGAGCRPRRPTDRMPPPRGEAELFEWIVDTVARSGYLGIALLMALETVFPPIPSELIMPLAGFAAARGDLGMAGVIAAGAAGSVIGALPWYVAGRWLGADRIRRLAARHGRWLTLTPDEIDGAVAWFGRHCGKAVLLGRLIPGVRTLISVPAGIARMAPLRFLAYSAAGTLLWTGLLAFAGYLLESQYGRVAAALDPVAKVIIAALLLGYAYRVATHGKGRPRPERRD